MHLMCFWNSAHISWKKVSYLIITYQYLNCMIVARSDVQLVLFGSPIIFNETGCMCSRGIYHLSETQANGLCTWRVPLTGFVK